MKELKELKLLEKNKLSELDEKGLKKELNSAAKQRFTLSMKKSLGEQKQTHLITALRKYIARVKTFASQKGFNID